MARLISTFESQRVNLSQQNYINFSHRYRCVRARFFHTVLIH